MTSSIMLLGAALRAKLSAVLLAIAALVGDVAVVVAAAAIGDDDSSVIPLWSHLASSMLS